MQNGSDVIKTYDTVAVTYGREFIDELSKKPIDRSLLDLFAEENSDKGKAIDLGCGPGQISKYLHDHGLTDIIGVDISSQMVKVARRFNPHLNFEVVDILKLKYPDSYFASAVGFYAIVNYDYDQVKNAFKEIRRVLADGGQFLFSFHIGNEAIHFNHFLGHGVNIDFYFFEIHKIIGLLAETGFEVIYTLERKHYDDFEYPSKRAYILTKARYKWNE